MGFSSETGKVTVDSDNKATPKSEISYQRYKVTAESSLAEVMEDLLKEGITEEVQTEEVDGELVIVGMSLAQLLGDAFTRFSYNTAVAKAKERFNNSPSKSFANLARIFQSVLDNPEATADQKAKAKAGLAAISVTA